MTVARRWWQRSVFRATALGMVALGLAAGSAFPGFMVLLGVSPSTAFRPLTIGSCLMAGLGVAAGNYALVRGVIGTRLRALAEGMTRVHAALQGATTSVPCVELDDCHLDATSEDELGHSANAFNQLLVLLRDTERSKEAGARAVRSAVEVLREAGERIEIAAASATSEAATASGAASEVGSSAHHAASCASRVRGTLASTARQAGDLASAAGQAADTVAQVSSISDAVNASCAEIAQRVDGITTISREIRLLALNAGIEATNAGPAGAGFRVVANEVDALAISTAASATAIAAQITASQRLTSDLVNAVTDLVGFATQVSSSQRAVAGSLDLEVEAVGDIVSATARAEHDADVITSVIGRATEATESTGTAVAEVRHAVDDLVRVASQLTEAVLGGSPGRPGRGPGPSRAGRSL